MTFSLIWKLVMRNFKSLSKIMMPFILAASVMFGLEYIMLSLMSNEYIQERHENLPQLIGYANVLTSILTVVFIIYANRFVMKQRKKEFALNTILGMEKKHLRLILGFEALIQFILIAIISIAGGYLFGNLIFMILNRLVKSTGITLMDYPFDMRAAMISLILLALLMIFLFMINNIILTLNTPLKLMQGQKAGEKKQKKWIIIVMFVLGIIGLVAAYYMALTTVGVINSLQTIFVAVLIVTISTYLLFMSLTILVLQSLQKIQGIYYKPQNFISISGLLSRMRANAVGLASIAVLCTFLMVTLGMSLTTYRGIEMQIKSVMKHDYEVTMSKSQAVKQLGNLKKDISNYADVDQFRQGDAIFVGMYNLSGTFEAMEMKPSQSDIKNSFYSFVTTVEGHNSLNDEHLSLKEGQVAISSNAERFTHFQNVTLGQKEFDVINLDKDYVGAKVGIDAIYMVVKDDNEMKRLTTIYKDLNIETREYEPASISTGLSFNIKGDEDKFNKQIRSIEKQYNIEISQKKEVSKQLYEMNGGLIFIGIVVSIILIAGMFLILYYKQISEGYEDKENYQIMKKVGLPESLIKTSINKQIFWIFALPILTAIIHTAFASKIIYQLMGLLGIRDVSLFLTSYLGVALVIMLVYGLMYWLTSRAYFAIINKEC
ncbi:FtsX-like permease family protein [Macrococcus hajekii]|uniref:FtsX-like permease family protein n=2 Tax=Macrococcus TaxID=69965 RepID=A0A4R6BJJ8_9STAP|nr:FtsX-like permease family protein [Macrococcus hajekii]TDM01721.1 FtsX-like permease family protein [Macrococcus hajekii]GGB06843.1 ABC transporter ATP-binding protein [Macrococcus hajekii]